MSIQSATLKSMVSRFSSKGEQAAPQRIFYEDFTPDLKDVSASLKEWKKTGQGSRNERLASGAKIAGNIRSELKQKNFNPSNAKLIAARDQQGKIRAVCLLGTPQNSAEASIEQLVSSPSSKAKGAGSVVRQAAEHYAREAGYQKITLLPYNQAVADLYKKSGYSFQKTPTAPNGIYGLDLQA